MILLVDADSLFWKAALAATQTWDGSTVGDLGVALRGFEGRLHTVFDAAGTNDHILCYTYGRSFRKDLAESYKAHRPKPPEFIGVVKRAVIERFGGIMFPGLEGDDVVGMHHNPFPMVPSETTVVYSEDKDLKQLSGLYLSLDNGIQFRTPDEALRFFYMQVLIGDAADGYPGCPGIGPKKAHMLLDGASREQLWDIVCLTFESKGLTEEHAILQARMAWILKWNNGGPMSFVVPKRMSNKLDWSKLR
jgi:DNA polymerase-1